MKALNERLQKMQEAQAARQDALQEGRIRVEPPKPEKTEPAAEDRQKKTSS